MRGKWTNAALLALVAGTVGCDQVSKQLASTGLADLEPRTYLGGSLRFDYAENPGAFLSLGAHWPADLRFAVFSVATAAILAVCGVLVFRNRWPGLARMGLALVFAGGVSNLADRLAHGRVIDFINVGIGSWRTGIFNVADVAIMSGVALLLVGQWRRKEEVGSLI